MSANASTHHTRRSGEMPRRDFLLHAGGAVAAGAVSGLARPAAAASLRSDDCFFEHRGFWWLSQGFFEYTLGPWQPYLPANPDLVAIWRSCIDWCADQGINCLVPQLGPWGGTAHPSPIGPDKIRFGWGYHYVLDFEKFPEARCTTDNAALLHPEAQTV